MKICPHFGDQHAPYFGKKGAKQELQSDMAPRPPQHRLRCFSTVHRSLGKFHQTSWCKALISYLIFHKCFKCVGLFLVMTIYFGESSVIEGTRFLKANECRMTSGLLVRGRTIV